VSRNSQKFSKPTEPPEIISLQRFRRTHHNNDTSTTIRPVGHSFPALPVTSDSMEHEDWVTVGEKPCMFFNFKSHIDLIYLLQKTLFKPFYRASAPTEGRLPDRLNKPINELA
jgi:hypothetical protein